MMFLNLLFDDFKKEVKENGLEKRIHYLSHGESYTFNINKNNI